MATSRTRKGVAVIRSVALRVLLAAALVISIPAATTAQEDRPTPEGTQWHLVAYDAGVPELTRVPWDIAATLTLEAGRAFGWAGCNGFGATYGLVRKAIMFRELGQTDMGCLDEAWSEVEDAYMALLPRAIRWATDSGPTGDRDLILFDADDEQLLRFSSSGMGLLVGQIRELTDRLEAQEKMIDDLRARIAELEPGG
jgi:heat shock protein HslJ